MEILQTGERTLLRHPVPADAPAFLAMVEASRALHHPWVHPPGDAAAFGRFVEHAATERLQGFLICLRDTGEIAGVATLSEIVRGLFWSTYLGFYASAAWAGRGFLKEGLGLVLRHAFGPLGLHRVEANVQPENTRSLALVRSLGFQKEGFSPKYLRIGGQWRDHERWAMLA
ncbi:MAG TPA: RimJ/RimL family protein N-acetyltransferase, partial [Acidobacteria bacterium]|nr:RimJ/RimL family protein N-acetyltransferase [Acidobacteriota bacterium]